MLILKLFFEHEVLSFKQINDLVEIYNATHIYTNRFFPENQIIDCLHKLEFEFQKIVFDSQNFCWKLVSDADLTLYELKEQPLTKYINYDPKLYKYLTIGEGHEFVYCLFVPKQKIEAILNNKKSYPIKIGKTNNIQRRIKELSVSGAECLAIDLIIKTDKSFQLEKAIHKVLLMQFANLDIPSRKEWFLSNRNEVKRIFDLEKRRSMYF